MYFINSSQWTWGQFHFNLIVSSQAFQLLLNQLKMSPDWLQLVGGNQLFIYKRDRLFELRTTENKFSK